MRLPQFVSLLACGLPLLSSCVIVVDPVETRCALTVEAPVVTFDPVAVGGTSTLKFKVSAAFADCNVTAVDVQNVDGTFFKALSLDAAGGTLTDDGALVVPQNGSAELAVRYAPTEVGFHTAKITLSVPNARKENPDFVVRASAEVPYFQVWPVFVDLGSVPVGTQRPGFVFVDNHMASDLVFTDAAFVASDGVATSGELFLLDTFPLTVPAGAVAVPIEVRYAPVVERVLTATLRLSVGGGTQEVGLSANDCVNGRADLFDLDGDGATACGDDCNDLDATVRPGAPESLDGRDNDCNGLIDDGTWEYDDDGDGYCDPDVPACLDPLAVPGDCNDHDAAINPGVVEVCPSAAPNCSDGIDNNCDGDVDGGLEDRDQDGYTAKGGDCDEGDPYVSPGAPETANHKDDDCDGVVDEGTVNADDDLDGYAEVDGDCDETVHLASLSNPYPGAAIHPFATELPDHRDNDCDGEVDEGTWLADDDGDGYAEGDPNNPAIDDRYRDCDDTNAARSPGKREIVGDPARLDEDCNPLTGP